jgi:hypothetical protein
MRLPMSWPARAMTAVFLTVCLGMWALGEAGIPVLIWAELGAATGLWSPPRGSVITGGTVTRYLVVAGGLFWIVTWTAGGFATAGWLHKALFGRDVIELAPGELRARPRWPRRPTRIPVAGIRGVYLLAGRGDVMVRTPEGSVRLTELGTAEDRAALAADLRRLLETPAELTWQPALPAGFSAEQRPEGLVIAATGRSADWLAGEGAVTVREHQPDSPPRVIFTGYAAELTAGPDAEDDESDDVICRLTLLGEQDDQAEPGGHRHLLLYSRNDPTVPREFGLWLAGHARITFDDQITE